MINSERLESHNSGDIVILNREPVGNPQSCHKGFQIPIAKFHQRANIMQCYVQSTLFCLTQVQASVYFVTHCAFVELGLLFIWCALQILYCGFFPQVVKYLPPWRIFYPKNVAELGGTLPPLYIDPSKISSNTLRKFLRTKYLKGFLRTKRWGGGMLSLWY